MKPLRIVTRPDFDGIVCAALIFDAENIKAPIKWVEPSEIQKGLAEIRAGDVIANLPYDERCTLWFDHHVSNRIQTRFQGSFKLAPSAARVIYEYYQDVLRKDCSALISETDKIDAAHLSLDEILHPEKYPYIWLSMTVSGHNRADEPYWNRLVDLMQQYEIQHIMDEPEVKTRCQNVVDQNRIYKKHLIENTRRRQHLSITDFRSFDKAPNGNRFLVYSLFPECVVSMKIRFKDETKKKVIINVGHSILNRNCRVNVGKMLTQFEGGGHRGAGSCTFDARKVDDYLPKIIDILLKNEGLIDLD